MPTRPRSTASGSWVGGTRRSSRISGRARVFELRDGPQGLEGTMISNTGDYGHFAGRVEGDSSHPGALRRRLRLYAHRRPTRRHPPRRVPRRAPDADAMDRRPEHGRTAPQDPHRDNQRRHQRAVPVRLPRSRRANGDGARPAFPRQGGAGGYLRKLVPDLSRRGAGAGTALPQVPRPRARDRRAGLRGHRRYRDRRPAGAALPPRSSAFRFRCCSRGSTTPKQRRRRCRSSAGSRRFRRRCSSGGTAACAGCTPGSTARRWGRSTTRMIREFEGEVERLLAERAR